MEAWHSAPVVIGGIKTTAAEVARALAVLTASAGMMVRQPLRKAGSELAACDYHAAALPWKQAAAAADPHRGRGAAGRHITKAAFMAALSAAVAAAKRAFRLAGFKGLVAEAIRAFGTDVSFAESICDLARAVRPAIATA